MSVKYYQYYWFNNTKGIKGLVSSIINWCLESFGSGLDFPLQPSVNSSVFVFSVFSYEPPIPVLPHSFFLAPSRAVVPRMTCSQWFFLWPDVGRDSAGASLGCSSGVRWV